MKITYSLPQEDLACILSQTEKMWAELRGKRIFLSGGTGFFGIWLVESFAFANERLGLGAQLGVLTRDVAGTHRRYPHLQSLEGVTFYEGDVRTFEFPEAGRGREFSHVIHAATPSGVESLSLEPLNNFGIIVEGTRRMLEFAVGSGVEKFLFVSSGAVYGEQPPQMSHVAEDYRGAPDPLSLKSTYGECKRLGEHLCQLYGAKYGFEAKTARPFAFVGPYLPLKAAFAIGNFLENILQESPIEILGDGSPFRSYLYAADLAAWLWTVLFKGQAGRAYNVGAEEEISIGGLASLLSQGSWISAPVPVHIRKTPLPAALASRYVPSTQRAQTELGLKQNYSLSQAIERTIEWHRAQKQSAGDPYAPH